jgi:hypothetical protein
MICGGTGIVGRRSASGAIPPFGGNCTTAIIRWTGRGKPSVRVRRGPICREAHEKNTQIVRAQIMIPFYTEQRKLEQLQRELSCWLATNDDLVRLADRRDQFLALLDAKYGYGPHQETVRAGAFACEPA